MRRLPLFALMAAALSLISCHGSAASTTATTTTVGTTGTTGITVVVSPATVSVIADTITSTQFFAALANNTNSVVTWKVNDVTGGNQTLGTIDSNGVYLPPAAVPSPATVTITAVSFEDPTATGTATVTILAPPTVTITPTSFTLAAGASEPFTATVTGAPTTNVDWKVNVLGGTPVLGGNLISGTILANGDYTAPLTPTSSPVTVTAVSRDFPQASASATVTISGFSTASLQGSYAFSLTGTNASGVFTRAGSFTADGAGSLAGGLEDVKNGSSPTQGISFVGAYTLGSDGRGTLQFSDGLSPSNFRFVLVNNGQLQIMGFETSGTATGQANLQDLSTFRASGLSATYVFDFTGVDSAGKPLSEVGEFTADGSGGIASGFLDTNDNSAITSHASFTGSYLVNSNGRGTATLGTMQFSFYIVSRGSAKFLEIDPGAQSLVGFTSQQTPNSTYDLTSLQGNFAFLVSGTAPAGKIATAGSFTADGNGHITAGVLDESINGVVTSNVPFANGAYTVDATGRGILTFTTPARTYQIVFYLGQTGNGVVQEIDSAMVSDGLLAKQQTGAFSLTSLLGRYAIAASGNATTFAGQLKSLGTGTIPSGTIDINAAGTLSPSEPVTGNYSVAANGRGPLSLNPSTDNRNFIFYIVSPTEAFLVGIDSGRVAAGTLLRQF